MFYKKDIDYTIWRPIPKSKEKSVILLNLECMGSLTFVPHKLDIKIIAIFFVKHLER